MFSSFILKAQSSQIHYYILDNTESSTSIDISNFSSGQYIVNLISSGQILDTQNLIIN